MSQETAALVVSIFALVLAAASAFYTGVQARGTRLQAKIAVETLSDARRPVFEVRFYTLGGDDRVQVAVHLLTPWKLRVRWIGLDSQAFRWDWPPPWQDRKSHFWSWSRGELEMDGGDKFHADLRQLPQRTLPEKVRFDIRAEDATGAQWRVVAWADVPPPEWWVRPDWDWPEWTQ